MGRLTQMYDYLNREPEDFSKDFVVGNYTKFTVDTISKRVRREYRAELRKSNKPIE